MRVAIVRTDIQKFYLTDIENTSQRDFSSQAKGQSRYFVHPTDVQLTAVLNQYALVSVEGSDTAATIDTTASNNTKLNIKVGSAAASFVQVTVRSGVAVTKAQIVSDLNLSFLNAGVAAHARLNGLHVDIDTTVGGPGGYIAFSAGTPSAASLYTALGIAVTAFTGLTVAALKTAVYTSATTVNVSSATILALSTFALMSAAEQTALVDAVQDLVAPRLVETSMVLRSFAYGDIFGLRSASFQPGGSRSGLPAGVAAVVVADDGSTPFTL